MGQIIFSACRWLYSCCSALEAELAACDEGLRLAMAWSQLPIVLNTDCAEAVSLISTANSNRSPFVNDCKEIAALIQGDREVLIKKVARSQVQAGHELAALGRSQQRTACWLGSCPDSISNIVMADCTPD